MFDPERILGQLIASSLRGHRSHRGALGSNASWMMGAIGVAMAAFEHFSEQSTTASASPASPDMPPVAPPVPPAPTKPTTSPTPAPATPAVVPPILAETVVPPTPPPPPPAGTWPTTARNERTASHQQALLLIRAMVVAAHADGHVDEDERRKIFDAALRDGLPSEDLDFLRGELSCPSTMDDIVREAHSLGLQQQVYGVSLLAIHVDSAAEHLYLESLATALNLTASDVAHIQTKMGG